jgi:hypothetical protein
MKRRRCARVCGAITVLFGSVVTVGVLLSAPQPSLAAIITSVGGDLTVVPQPTNLIYGNTIFSGITSPTPIIFNEYTNHMIPVFSALDPSNPVLVQYGLPPSVFVGLDYLPVDTGSLAILLAIRRAGVRIPPSPPTALGFQRVSGDLSILYTVLYQSASLRTNADDCLPPASLGRV